MKYRNVIVSMGCDYASLLQRDFFHRWSLKAATATHCSLTTKCVFPCFFGISNLLRSLENFGLFPLFVLIKQAKFL